MQSPFKRLLSSMYFITAGIPPTLCKSSIRNLPLGFKSAKKGVDSEIFWKSSIEKLILALLAIARI